jgi:hypothetical protein
LGRNQKDNSKHMTHYMVEDILNCKMNNYCSNLRNSYKDICKVDNLNLHYSWNSRLDNLLSSWYPARTIPQHNLNNWFQIDSYYMVKCKKDKDIQPIGDKNDWDKWGCKCWE